MQGDELKIDGGTWVDVFGLVFIIRLLAVLLHMPPVTMAEAGLWGATITSFAYSNTPKGPTSL